MYTKIVHGTIKFCLMAVCFLEDLEHSWEIKGEVIMCNGKNDSESIDDRCSDNDHETGSLEDRVSSSDSDSKSSRD